jgi:hypothetical protein
MNLCAHALLLFGSLLIKLDNKNKFCLDETGFDLHNLCLALSTIYCIVSDLQMNSVLTVLRTEGPGMSTRNERRVVNPLPRSSAYIHGEGANSNQTTFGSTLSKRYNPVP